MSDLFIDKQTKRYFNDYEQKRDEMNLPKTMMDMTIEQIQRIHKFIKEEKAKTYLSKNDKV